MKRLLTMTLTTALVLTIVPLWAGEEKSQKTCSEEDAAICAKMMKEQFSQRGWVGINMDYDKERELVAISNVVANSPASRAGFEIGDVLRGLNDIKYNEENEETLKAEYASFKSGSTATFKVERDGKMIDIEVQLEQIPEAILAQWVGQHVLEYHEVEAEVAVVEDEDGGESP